MEKKTVPADRLSSSSKSGRQEGKIEKEGTVRETLPNAVFRVELDDGEEVLAYISGKMRRYRIKTLVGDRVKVEISPYDQKKGRLVYRYKVGDKR